jgi:hypothetical protein
LLFASGIFFAQDTPTLSTIALLSPVTYSMRLAQGIDPGPISIAMGSLAAGTLYLAEKCFTRSFERLGR